MSTNTAKSTKTSESPRRLVFILFPEAVLLDIAGPLQVFHQARSDNSDTPCYEPIFASVEGGRIATDTGVTFDTITLHEAATTLIDTLIVAGGRSAITAATDKRLTDWIATQSQQVRRVGSVCMGAFILAAAGVLDHRRAVTHWRWCEQLQQSYPLVQVDATPIYVKDGHIWSSAGVSAGIDLALAMVEEDLGHTAAMQLAQSLVIFVKRPGGQAQFSNLLKSQINDGLGRFDTLHAWIIEHLAEDLSIELLAEQVSMSPRNFYRKYKEITGLSPARAVERFRLEEAQRLLTTTKQSIASISRRCGFSGYEGMRRCFMRHIGVSPQDYRERFGTSSIA